jgi:phosphonate transport system substrate-binding protein
MSTIGPRLALALALALAAGAGAAEGSPGVEKAYTFAIVPQVPPHKLAMQWLPVVERVSALSGVKLAFVTAPSMDDFYKRSVAREYEFALENPLTYVRTESGYTAFARQARARLVGLIFVPKESPLKSLCELKGKRFAVGSHGAFVASVVPMHALQQECSLDLRRDVQIVVTGAQDMVFPALLAGRADALGVNQRIYDMQPQDVQERFRVLYRTRDFSNLPFVARRDVPADVVKKVQAALVALKGDPTAGPLLEAIGMPTGIEAAAPADWDDVRRFETELVRAAEAIAAQAGRR